MAVGKELKRIRQLNGSNGKDMSRRILAEYLGVSEGALRKWEDFDNNPKRIDAARIEQYFGVGINELNKIGKFAFYTKEITKESTNETKVFQNVNLEMLINHMQEKLIGMQAAQAILIQELSEMKVKMRRLSKEPETSVSWERLELLKIIDGESDRLFSELKRKLI